MRSLLFLPLIAAVPLTALAQPISFEEALSVASADAPQVRARALVIDAREAEAIAAGELPDPKVGVALDNFPITGPPAFSLSAEPMTMVTVSASQEIPSAAKRRARRTRAQADVGEARASLAETAREVRVETALAWLDLAYAERRLTALDEAVGAVAAYQDTSIAAVASGSARPAQSLEVRIAVAELQDQRSELEAERERAAATLARWTGEPDPRTEGPVPSFQPDRKRLTESLDMHPRLTVSGARVRQAEADVGLATAEKRPDLMVDFAYQRRDPDYGDMVSAGVTVSLPLFAKRRQDPIVAARTAATQAALAEQENVRRELVAELQAGLAGHAMRLAQLERARNTLLPLARQQSALETASYAAGRASLVDVIDARIELAQAELAVIDREFAAAREAARLVLTYGDPE